MNKAILFASILSLAAGAAWVGCGSDETGDSDSNDDDGEGGSGGGSTGTGNTGNPTSSSSSSSSSSSGPGSGGSGNAGGGSGECADDAPAVAPSMGSCVMIDPGGGGAGGGGGGVECNPVTNEPCGATEACDVAGEGAFTCYPDGNIGGLCEECDGETVFCQGTLACDGTTCHRYCCTDADCGTGTCEKGVFGATLPDLGICAP